MVNSTFPVMDELIWVWAMPEFVHQDCVKLIRSVGAHKHGFPLKPLSYKFSSSLSTFLKWKIKKMFKKVNETVKKIFFPYMSASWCDQLNDGVNKLTRRKLFLWQKFPCRNVGVYHRCEIRSLGYQSNTTFYTKEVLFTSRGLWHLKKSKFCIDYKNIRSTF